MRLFNVRGTEKNEENNLIEHKIVYPQIYYKFFNSIYGKPRTVFKKTYTERNGRLPVYFVSDYTVNEKSEKPFMNS